MSRNHISFKNSNFKKSKRKSKLYGGKPGLIVTKLSPEARAAAEARAADVVKARKAEADRVESNRAAAVVLFSQQAHAPVDLEVPVPFICIFSQEIMKDPVLTEDGHTYERARIEEWLISHNTSPNTGLPLSTKNLVPNLTLKKIIKEFCEQHKSLCE